MYDAKWVLGKGNKNGKQGYQQFEVCVCPLQKASQINSSINGQYKYWFQYHIQYHNGFERQVVFILLL